jgi:diguanylate cyclase (GGDEF)-like protein
VAEDEKLALAVLERMETAILKRESPGRYSLFGHAPEFYRKLYCTGDGGICTDPWSQSPMLDFFLADAEAFFESGAEGRISSGIWQEEGIDGERALSAEAVRIGEHTLLILRLLHEEYAERLRILRKARSQLLAQRSLRSTLESYMHKASYDALTGLYNRASFAEALKEAVREAAETGGTFSLLFMDVDNFKQVNDTYGHLSGDAVLSTLGKILMRYSRNGDISARYGGEELAVIARGAPREYASLIAENLRKHIEGHDFNLPRKITVSIGCTAYIRGDTMEAVLERADQALYEAKRGTKNVVIVR